MLVSIGDNCVDYYRAPLERHHVGGNALNVAANLALHGVPAAYVGIVGSDSDGEQILSALHAIGVNVTCVRRVSGATGVTEIELTGDDYCILREDYGVSDSLCTTPELLAFTRKYASGIHLTVSGQAHRVIDDLAPLRIPVTVDLGKARAASSLAPHARLCEVADAVFISAGAELADAVVEELLRAALRLGARHAIATRGQRGASVILSGHLWSLASRVTAESVVDPLGAGDAFIAGFLSRTAGNFGMKDRMEGGMDWAAAACGHIGAWPSAPLIGANDLV